MDPIQTANLLHTRRQLFNRSAVGLGTLALSSLLSERTLAEASEFPSFAPKAKRVIYLLQSGAPSQMDLYDYKPHLKDRFATDLPDSIRQGQRLTGMTSKQDRFPVAPSMFEFSRHGSSGMRFSELIPHTASIADDICVIRSMHTQAINHDPAITFFQTGAQLAGRPSMGAWLSYGLGSENDNLPTFVSMVSGSGGQPLYDRLWGSGFLPTQHQGIKFRSVGDSVLFLSNPAGLTNSTRRRFLDDLSKLNHKKLIDVGDPEIATRMSQYELAYRMQTSVPELTDLSHESKETFELYGEDAKVPGTYASNCLLARRLAERDVRFIQLFHRGWDQHTNLPRDIRKQAAATDQASAGLIRDLKQRGMLDDTLVVWAGEFGRTVYCQGTLTKNNYGRDHHPRCFSIWLAGGGIKGGMTYGTTDEFSYNILENPVHVHDLHATMLHCLGIDHKKLTFKFQGRHYRLTDVHGNVVRSILT